MSHDPTCDVYERRAGEWMERRAPADIDRDEVLGSALATEARAPVGAPLVDLGCGPGWHVPLLGPRAVAADAAISMLALVPEHAPGIPRLALDLRALPLRRASLAGALASKSYVHVQRSGVPLALHDLHRSLVVGAPVSFVLFAGDAEHEEFEDDAFEGRRFSLWPEELLRAVIEGAGFIVDEWREAPTRRGAVEYVVRCTRARTLADTVGPGMRLLVIGLNPSLYAADVGVGFARPGNRFWPALLTTGLAERDRDPVHALTAHGIGMTDLVKRATARADELTADEYRNGLARVERIVEWLEPLAVCVVGLAGWRAAVDRRAQPGVQPSRLGGRPTYVMPSTSGANAHRNPDSLAAHLLAAMGLAGAAAVSPER